VKKPGDWWARNVCHLCRTKDIWVIESGKIYHPRFLTTKRLMGGKATVGHTTKKKKNHDKQGEYQDVQKSPGSKSKSHRLEKVKKWSKVNGGITKPSWLQSVLEIPEKESGGREMGVP